MTTYSVVRASTAYLAVNVAEIAASLISVPVMTRLLSPSEYGIMLLITNITALVNLLFGFSLAQALPSLFTASDDVERRRATATTIIWAITAVAAVVTTALVLVVRHGLHEQIAALSFLPPIALAGLASFAVGTSLCVVSLVRLRERPGLIACVQIPATALQLGLLMYFLAVPRLGLSSLYLAMSIVGLSTTAIYAWSMRTWLTGRFDRQILSEAIGIAVRMLPWQAATLLATNSSGFLLVRRGHIEEAGMFAVAAGLVTVLVGVSNSFCSAWTPYVLNRQADPTLVSTQLRMFRLFSSGLLFAACALSLFAQEVFSVLLGPAFQKAYHFVPPLMLAYSLFCFANAFSQGLQAKQQMPSYAGVGLAVAGVFLAVGLPLTTRFGAYGLIAAMGLAFLTMLVALQRISERLMPVGYPWWRHGLMWLLAIGIVAATYGIGSSWQGLASKAAATVAIACLPFAFGAIRKVDIRDFWSTMLGLRA